MLQTFVMITFTPEIETLIQIQLQSGLYRTQEEVVLAGLQLLEHRDSIYQGRFEELRQEVLIGVEKANRGELIDGDVVFQQLRDRLEQRRNQSSVNKFLDALEKLNISAAIPPANELQAS
jgi:antitoxin ParD1/3/4